MLHKRLNAAFWTHKLILNSMLRYDLACCHWNDHNLIEWVSWKPQDS